MVIVCIFMYFIVYVLLRISQWLLCSNIRGKIDTHTLRWTRVQVFVVIGKSTVRIFKGIILSKSGSFVYLDRMNTRKISNILLRGIFWCRLNIWKLLILFGLLWVIILFSSIIIKVYWTTWFQLYIFQGRVVWWFFKGGQWVSIFEASSLVVSWGLVGSF